MPSRRHAEVPRGPPILVLCAEHRQAQRRCGLRAVPRTVGSFLRNIRGRDREKPWRNPTICATVRASMRSRCNSRSGVGGSSCRRASSDGLATQSRVADHCSCETCMLPLEQNAKCIPQNGLAHMVAQAAKRGDSAGTECSPRREFKIRFKKNVSPKTFAQNVSPKTFAQNVSPKTLLAPKPLTISINPKP